MWVILNLCQDCSSLLTANAVDLDTVHGIWLIGCCLAHSSPRSWFCTAIVLLFMATSLPVLCSRAEDPGFESRLCRDFFGVESYQ